MHIYSEPGGFLPGFQALYNHFTIWHAHSTAHVHTMQTFSSSPQYRNPEIYDKEQFKKYFNSGPVKFVNINGS